MAKKIKAPKENKGTFKKTFKRLKNMISFLLVVVFAGFVFYTGWIQIRIPEGSHALVYTKTGGYDKSLIAPGQFVWRWENLFPTNMTLHFIELNNQKEELYISAYLPSGQIYGEYINRPEAFKYSIAMEYSFVLKETALDRLVESGAFTTDKLDALNRVYRESSNALISEYIKNKSAENLKELMDMEKELASVIAEKDRDFVVTAFKIKNYSYPDIVLYEKSRTLFLEELEKIKEIDFEAEQLSQQLDNASFKKMELLRQYGEILSDYPVLLQYFGLDRDKLDPALLKKTEILSSTPGSE